MEFKVGDIIVYRDTDDTFPHEINRKQIIRSINTNSRGTMRICTSFMDTDTSNEFDSDSRYIEDCFLGSVDFIERRIIELKIV